MPSEKTSWRQWTAREWNSALFRHWFIATECDASAVTRLVVTPDVLCRATRDPGADADQVRDAFLEALRDTPRAIRRAFSDAWLTRGQWTSVRPPPFFVYLALTCFVASAADEEVLTEGDFRRRLRVLLRHNRLATYRLKHLPLLWRALSDWLQIRRSAGVPYRQLALPDPGWTTLIGYSLRLAFPARRDQIRLMELFSDEGFDDDPPVRAVLRVVGTNLTRFGKTFRESYEDFRRLFVQGHVAENHPFWAAVREAAGVQLQVNSRTAGYRLQLYLEINDEFEMELVLMSDADFSAPGVPLECFRTEALMGDFRFVVSASDYVDDERGIIQLLLDGKVTSWLPSLRSTPLGVALRQRVLLFRRNEFGAPELATAASEEEDHWALVHNSLARAFAEAFPAHQRPTYHPSRYEDWSEFPRFAGSHFSVFETAPDGPLGDVRCIQATARGSQILLPGGIPVDRGLLGMPACLPRVRANGADSVQVFRVTGDRVESGREAELQLFLRRSSEDADIFDFPDGLDGLDGEFSIVARAGDSVVAQRVVVFRADLAWDDYVQPTTPRRWLMESGGPDTRDPLAVDRYSETGIATNDASSPSHAASPGRVPRPVSFAGSQIRRLQSDESDAGVANLCELLAGLATRRKGIPEAELLDRFRGSLRLDDQRVLWDVVRAWQESGCIDRFVRVRWRGRMYFARPPRLLVWKSGRDFHATVTGLPTRATRNQLATAMERHGARRRPGFAMSPWTAPIQNWSAESASTFKRVSHEVEIPPPGRLPDIADVGWPISRVVGNAPEPPLNFVHHGTWDWATGRFAKPVKETRAVALNWYRRPDQPDHFAVLVDGSSAFWSNARNWAVLAAYSHIGQSPFEITRDGQFIRTVRGQVYLPVPLARWLSVVTRTAPGPINDAYAYGASNPSTLAAVVRLLWGTDLAPVDANHIRRLARWMLSVADNTMDDRPAVPLPPELCRRLLALERTPEARELAFRAVPPALIPHIRRLLLDDERGRRW